MKNIFHWASGPKAEPWIILAFIGSREENTTVNFRLVLAKTDSVNYPVAETAIASEALEKSRTIM